MRALIVAAAQGMHRQVKAEACSEARCVRCDLTLEVAQGFGGCGGL